MTEIVKINLPTVAELFEDNLEIAHKNEQLNLFLSQNPPDKWVKEHPYISGYKYLPIDKIEHLLRKIFKQYTIEITGQGTSFNGVWVTVRIHYLNPVTKKMEFHDGIGAEALQVKKGTSPSDLANINNGAISMAFPKAKTSAIKDACDHFGNIFGANLNRKDTLNFSPDQTLSESDFPEEIKEQLDLITDLNGLDKYVWQVTESDKKLNKNWAFRSAVDKKRKELTPKTN